MHALVFPGQGSQFVGMGKDLSDAYVEAREVFEEVNDSLSQDLTKIMFEGAESDLNLTENTQPALMAVSVAVMRVLEKQGHFDLAHQCAYVAGHSLGEYSALTAAETLKLSDAARLLKLRGQAMQDAVPVGQGAMVAVLGLDYEQVQSIAGEASKDNLVCEIANDNSAGQIVISGHKGAVDAAAQLAQDKGAKRAVSLPVSAPFHSSLMGPAADKMHEALAETQMEKPVVPVVANVTAQAEQDPDTIRSLLVKQVTGTVRWRESIHWMAQNGVTQVTEIGAGKVLTGLIRRIEKEITTGNVGTPEQIDAFLQS